MLACLFTSLLSFAQGVQFQELTLKEALSKAAAENKLVFLDGYTTWCGPCRNMTENVFPQKECGDFFNKHFVNVKFDMEKGEGIDIKNQFKVKAFPTFLILNPDGSERYRVVGGGTVESFIERVERAFDPKNNLETMAAEYATGKMKIGRKIAYLTVLKDAYDSETEKTVSEDIVATASKKEKLSKDYWPIFSNLRSNPASLENIQFVLDNQKKLNKNVGKEKVDQYIASSYQQLIASFYPSRRRAPNAPTPDINILNAVEQQVSSSNMENKELVLMNIEIARASQDKDINKALDILEANPQLVPGNQITNYSSVLSMANGNKAACARVASLLDRKAEELPAADRVNLTNYANSFHKMAHVGVYWEDLTLEEALKKAQMMRTLVFLDCYTTWCGPCKYMTENIFPQEEVGDFFNRTFINVKLDMEKGDGPEIGKKYTIRAYPTFLILNPDGSIRHKMIGGGDAQGIIERAKAGLNEETASGTKDKKYEAGNRDKAFLAEYVTQLLGSYESDKAQTVAAELLAQLSDEEKTSKEFWSVYSNQDLSGLNSENFAFIVKNKSKYIQSVGKEEVNKYFIQAYTTKLMPVVAGRDQKTTVAELNELKKTLISYKLDAQTEIVSCIEIAKAALGKNTTTLLNVCQKEFKNLSEQTGGLAYYTLGNLRGQVSEKQQAAFNKLIDQVAEKNAQMAPYLKQMAF